MVPFAEHSPVLYNFPQVQIILHYLKQLGHIYIGIESD